MWATWGKPEGAMGSHDGFTMAHWRREDTRDFKEHMKRRKPLSTQDPSMVGDAIQGGGGLNLRGFFFG